jgi:hypothetical protein
VPAVVVIRRAQPSFLIKESLMKLFPEAIPVREPEWAASETMTSEADVVVTWAPVGVALAGWLFKQPT